MIVRNHTAESSLGYMTLQPPFVPQPGNIPSGSSSTLPFRPSLVKHGFNDLFL